MTAREPRGLPAANNYDSMLRNMDIASMDWHMQSNEGRELSLEGVGCSPLCQVAQE